MKKSSLLLRYGVVVMLAIFAICIYAGVNFAQSINQKYNEQDLKIVIDETSESEGFCLTDYVNKYSLSYSGIQSLYKDACVSIEVDSLAGSWLGSGVCVASNGYSYGENLIVEGGSYIVTNYHVIESFYSYYDVEIKVYPNDYLNTERYGHEACYDAEILWADSYIDMALLHIEENIDWVEIKDRSINSDTPLQANENAFVIGTPQSLSYQNTVTTGVINSSELKYSYTVQSSYFTSVMSNIYEDVIPMQISIMGGNSGGGLFDSNGYLVGLPTLGSNNSQSKNAVNYAIPIYPLTLVLDRLVVFNEGENESEDEIHIVSIDNLDFVVIDKKESEIMTTQFRAPTVYFYGYTYIKAGLEFSENGLMVINKAESSQMQTGDVIVSVTLNEKVFELADRNDLIYVLLETESGDMLDFKLKSGSNIQVLL